MEKIFYKDSKEELVVEIFKKMPAYNKEAALQNFNFYEFDLKDLNLPASDILLKNVLEIEKLVGLKSWINKDTKSWTYKGFSLTYNPNYCGDIDSVYHQTWGTTQLTQNFSRHNENKNLETKDTYYDTYAFRKISPFVKEYLGDFLNQFSFPLLRSRVAFFNPSIPPIGKDGSWHIDETPEQLLRINIPLQTSSEHVLDIIGKDDIGNEFNLIGKHLEVGKAYIWNTRIPHRVYINKPIFIKKPRIHLVLGFSPWVGYNPVEDYFYKTNLFGMNLNELVSKKLFLKSFDNS